MPDGGPVAPKDREVLDREALDAISLANEANHQ